MGVLRQMHLGLRKLMERAWVRPYGIAGPLEKPVSETGLFEATGQYGRIDGILGRRAAGEFVEKPARALRPVALEQVLDQNIRKVGNSVLRPDVGKAPEDLFAPVEFVAPGI